MNILITGGTSGIGYALAKNLLDLGHNVFVTGRNPSKTKILEGQFGNNFECRKCDVRDPKDVENAYENFKKRFGLPDLAVLNAGVGYFGPLESLTHEQFDIQFDTNVKGVFNWLSLLVPDMKKQGHGQIIVTSSNLGLETAANASIYSATKHAVQAMVSCLRKELVGTGVKAATINPGSVDTPWFDGKKVNREKMLRVSDVVSAFMTIINQNETSDIELISLLPSHRS